jgi:hypothetical protein
LDLDDDLERGPLSELEPPKPETQMQVSVEEVPEVSNAPLVSYGSCIKEEIKPIYDPDVELKTISRRLLRCQKYALVSSVISINVALIFCSWYVHPEIR